MHLSASQPKPTTAPAPVLLPHPHTSSSACRVAATTTCTAHAANADELMIECCAHIVQDPLAHACATSAALAVRYALHIARDTPASCSVIHNSCCCRCWTYGNAYQHSVTTMLPCGGCGFLTAGLLVTAAAEATPAGCFNITQPSICCCCSCYCCCCSPNTHANQG